MLKKIALEEHFLSPGLIDYWAPTVAELKPAVADAMFRALTDLGDARLQAMERAGIVRAILSAAGPGVQAEPVIATAARKASESNEFLGREIQKRPRSYLGFAHLPMQNPAAAADELERCVRDLDFCGALIHGHSQGHYLDEASFDVFWERAQALDAPVYLHRADPLVPAPVLAGYRMLRGPGWEAAFETGSHALRLVFGGVFDRFPKARIILGQLGDMLPYMLASLDAQAQRDGATLDKPPSDYFRDNIFVTTSGLLAAAPLYCAVTALGPDQVMFGTGYPFEPIADAAHFLDSVRLDEGLRADIAYRNAARVFRL
jgi:2,3-dihydroxybenzoate decarboxylase